VGIIANRRVRDLHLLYCHREKRSDEAISCNSHCGIEMENTIFNFLQTYKKETTMHPEGARKDK